MPRQHDQDGKVARNRAFGSDYEQELWTFFSGGYGAAVGLRSALGGQLDRLQNETGPGQHGVGDEWTFMIQMRSGPGGRLELAKVPRAVAMLMESCPAPKRNSDREEPTGQQVAAHQKLALDWPHFYPVLRAFYTRRPPGALEGLIAPYAEFAAVALIVPRARVLTATWCRARLVDDLAASRAAVTQSRDQHLVSFQSLEEEILKLELVKPPGWRLKLHQLNRQLDAAKQPARQNDTEQGVRNRWSNPGEIEAVEALRSLAKRCQQNRDTPERVESRRLQNDILEQCRALWRGARTAYADARRQVDKDLRHRASTHELDDFKASMGPAIGSDVD